MIKKKIYGNTTKERLVAGSKDRLYNFLLADGTVRGVILNGTKMINEMRVNHGLGMLETLVLGHAYMGCGLMSADLKGRDRISFQVDCSGPIKGFVVEANSFNEVRGYLKQVPIPIDKPLDDFNLSLFFGAGFLIITRYLEDRKHPFIGKVTLEYGNIAQDLAHYYLTSEQVPTAFNLSIQFDSAGQVVGAGGLFLQVMPDASEVMASGLEEGVRKIPSIGRAYNNGETPEELIAEAFEAYSPKFLSNRRIEFLCHCNEKRMQRFLAALPKEDIKDILDTGPFPVEIRCHHCNTRYEFTRSDISRIYGSSL